MSKNYTEPIGEDGVQFILIVEANRALRDALSRWLEARIPHCRTCASGTVEGALAAGRVLRPRLVVMDMRLEGGSGVEAIVTVKRALPEATVVIFTHFDAAIYREKALEAGASGYVLKRNPERDLVPLVGQLLGRGAQRSRDEIEGEEATSTGDET